MKKGRKPAIESCTPCSFLQFHGPSKVRFRYQNLLQDYEELIKDLSKVLSYVCYTFDDKLESPQETELKKIKLLKANQKKQKLLAEVKFLKRKYTHLSENPSGKSQHRLKKRMLNMSLQLIHNDQSLKSAIRSQCPGVGDTISTVGEDVVPSTCKGIDLNQNAEETQEFQVIWEPLKIDKSKCSVKGDLLSTNPNHSINGKAQYNSNEHAGNNKITWLDQVVLWV